MQRIYYLTDKLESLVDVSELLQKEGVGKWRVRVLSKNESGLYRSQLRSTQIYQDNDMIHYGELGAFIGGALGLLLAYLFKIIDPFDIPIPWQILLIISGVCTCFGAWSGGLFGIAQQNYKTYKFSKKIDSGNHVVLVDIPKKDKKKLCNIIKKEFPDLKKLGEDSTIIHPFDLKFWQFFFKKRR